MDVSGIKYTGATPGADANTYPLFNTVTAGFGAWQCQGQGYKRLVGVVNTIQDGTIKYYYSLDRGSNWVQVGGDFAATASATDVTTFDFLIEPFPDFKVDWVNGGAAQTGWTVTMALTDQRSAAT